ncbi:MAG: MvaI/BcnI family restriction endonuclease [Candidatus Omnitrophota bacterium]
MVKNTIIYTKQKIIERLKEINASGWIKNARHGNAGGVGNTLEDLLGIEENNLPIPNAAEWELKCQRMDTNSLITLFHMEPSPRAIKFVPKVFLPLYGWKQQTISKEMSFRQTINGLSCSDRGFKVVVDRTARKVLISFNAKWVSDKHKRWLNSVKKKVGLFELNPQPYWGFDDLFHKAGTKLLNCFYIRAEVKIEKGKEYFWYKEIMILQKFSLNKFIKAIEEGFILVDFDARSGHNHGTKFRLRQDKMPKLYDEVRKIV